MAVKSKGTHPGTELARQAFLYQGVTEIKDLAELSGKAECTIRGHMEKWVAEREETLKNANPLVPINLLSVPDEVLEAHKADLSFIRQRLDETKREITQLDSIIANLEKIVNQISSNFGDSSETDKLLRLFDKYLRLSMNKKSLDKHFMDLKSMWDSKSGVDSLKNIQESTAKAVSLANAKSAPSEQETVKENVVNDGVFRKRI